MRLFIYNMFRIMWAQKMKKKVSIAGQLVFIIISFHQPLMSYWGLQLAIARWNKITPNPNILRQNQPDILISKTSFLLRFNFFWSKVWSISNLFGHIFLLSWSLGTLLDGQLTRLGGIVVMDFGPKKSNSHVFGFRKTWNIPRFNIQKSWD